MNSRRSNKPVILFTAISVMLATLAPETSAQSRSTTERPLSDAIVVVPTLAPRGCDSGRPHARRHDRLPVRLRESPAPPPRSAITGA